MNVHHLELFYFVARHRGISEAARHMPYGIQQPAISAQMIRLEEALGASLFHRKPFQLTAEGERLFAFVEPFFSKLPELPERIRGRFAETLRIGASDVVLGSYLPALLRRIQIKVPLLKLSLVAGLQGSLELALRAREIDAAVTVLATAPGHGIASEELIRLPLVLLVPVKSRHRTFDSLCRDGKGRLPLISVPGSELLHQIFQEALAARGLVWLPSVEVSSLSLVATYAAQDCGAGLSVSMPGRQTEKGLRAIPLPGFPPLAIALLWRDDSPAAAAFAGEVKILAAEMRSHRKKLPIEPAAVIMHGRLKSE